MKRRWELTAYDQFGPLLPAQRFWWRRSAERAARLQRMFTGGLITYRVVDGGR